MRAISTRLFMLTLIATFADHAIADPLPTAPTQYPGGELGEMVKLGEDIIMHTNTHPLTRDLVGSKLTCSSCHIDGGKAQTMGNFLGTASTFPAYFDREKTVQTLQDRIANCFMRSLNGKRPIIDSKASIAMTAYVTWLSEGQPIKLNTSMLSPPDKTLVAMMKGTAHANYVSGGKIYAERCSACHGGNGEGTEIAPPLWGSDSYNTGAGMSKPVKTASWVKQNMPKGDANLSNQEAVDVSLFVDAQPRPAFDLQAHLLPKEQMGYYNAALVDEKTNARSNLKALGLDIDAIRGDRLIP